MNKNERIIAELHGEPVYGVFCSDTQDPEAWGLPQGVEYRWAGQYGVGVARDANGTPRVALYGFSVEYMTLAEWGALRELVRAGAMEQLVELAVAFFAGPRWDVPLTTPRPQPPTWADIVAAEPSAQHLDDVLRRYAPALAERIAPLSERHAMAAVNLLLEVAERSRCQAA